MTVYFIRNDDTGLVKIGLSVDPLLRLRQLQTGQAARLTLLATVPGEADREAALHRRFAADRVSGEWFKPSVALSAVIASATPIQRKSRSYGKVQAPGEGFTIDNLRHENGWTLEAFAERLGIRKSYLCQISNGTLTCSVRVALAIEALSHGRIYAGDLCADVKLVDDSRAALPIPARLPRPADAATPCAAPELAAASTPPVGRGGFFLRGDGFHEESSN